MADLPIRKSRDLRVPNAQLNIARAELSIAEQQIVLDTKELRLLEIAEERERLEADLADNLQPEAKVRDAELAALTKKEGDSTTGTYRARIRARQQHLAIQQKEFRLLELDEEQAGTETDIEASQAHIATLEAEVRQQRERLNRETGTDG